jgi:hypothetical protein
VRCGLCGALAGLPLDIEREPPRLIASVGQDSLGEGLGGP